MRNVKVTYIPENAANEVVATLVDVVRVHENMRNGYLNVEIDDAAKRNEASVLAPMMSGTIVKVELLNANNGVDATFNSYIDLRPVNRIYYDSEEVNTNEKDILRLVFSMTKEEK